MKTNITKMKGKKVLSLLLALIMVLSVGSPAFSEMFGITAGAATSDALATVITASDFQDSKSGNAYEEAFGTMMQKAKANGVDEPDGFILGGDYEGSYAEDHDTPTAYKRVESVIAKAYPFFNKKNIVNIQGNHDDNDPSVIDQTGPHEFEDYIVYVINCFDYPAGTGGTTAKNKTQVTSDNLAAYFNKLKAEGETRPIFIATHIPLHHNPRNPNAKNSDDSYGYNENLYGKILFDVVNENAKIFDIIFLFGHNHSKDYDDYIGGSVNYLGKGDEIRIPDYTKIPNKDSYKKETLNFTYMNYGYVGSSGNTEGSAKDYSTGETVQSTNTLTMGAFEICPDRIVATKYSENGVYKEYTIERNMKTNSPAVTVDGYSTGKVGSAAGVVAIASGFEDPVFTWTSSNEDIAKVSYTGKAAEIAYNAAGTATIKVKATEKNDSSKSAIYTYDVTVSADAGSTPEVAIYRAKEKVTSLEYYQINLGDTVALSGSYTGLTKNATTSWSSDNPGVATVNSNGLVTFVGVGEANIIYTVTDNGTTYPAQVKLVVSTEKKFEYKYEQRATLVPGKSYVLASVYITGTKSIHNYEMTTSNNLPALSGMPAAIKGSEGNFYLYLDDISYVWEAENAGDDYVYLKNKVTGKYLAASDKGAEDGHADLGSFVLTDTAPSNGKWKMSENTLQTSEGLKWYARGSGACNITSKTGRNAMVLEQVASDPHVNIEFSGEILNGITKTFYLAVKGRQIELEKDCRNINQIQSESWTSSDQSVATIDNKGVVTFKGVDDGTTVITYKATDINGKKVTAFFTLEAFLTAEGTRLFKYVDKVTTGKNYVIVDKKSVGVAKAISSFEVSFEKLLADRVDVTVEDGASYIEIPENLTEVVWRPETAVDSSFYLKNEANQKYLYATTDGSYDDYDALNGKVLTSESRSSTAEYTWTYDDSRLYNNFTYTDARSLEEQTNTYVRVRGGEFPGIAAKTASEKIYFFEEIEPKPKAVITSRYEVLDKTVERTEICPNQTEQLHPVAQNFTDNNSVNFEWSSNNLSVAKIDENGKLTYTGKEGKVTITLTATQGDDVAKTSVVFDVIGGVGYVDPPSDTVYTENAFYKTDKLVPGRSYVLHTNWTTDNGSLIADNRDLAISNENKSGHVRLLCEVIEAPQTDENGEYVVTTNDKLIWIAEKSSVEGYVYLKNKYNGQYLFISRLGGTDKGGVAASPQSHPDAANYANAEEAFLIKAATTAGKIVITSKQLFEEDSARGFGNVAIKSDGTYCYIRIGYGANCNDVTLYEEPVAGTPDEPSEPELPDGDVYYLTDKLESGKKYIIARNDVAGSTYIAANTLYTDGATPRAVTTTVQTLSGEVFIANPQNALVLTCEESEKEGYYYLKDEAGKYFTSYFYRFTNADGVRETNENAVKLTGLDEGYDRIYKQLKYENSYLQNGGGTTTAADGSKTITSSFVYFYMSTNNANPRMAATYYGDSANKVYLFALKEKTETPEEPDTPVEENVPIITEIRKQDDFGSVDITRTIQHRYDIEANYTEQLLAYIRGIKGYKTTWSTSDASIATIDENGVLTCTGKAGYVDVMLTVEGKNFKGDDIKRPIKTTFDISAEQDKTRIAVPETVYMTPASGASKVGQIYVNNVMDPNDSYNVKTIAERVDDMYFGLRVVGAKSFTVSISNATDPSNDINLYKADGSAVNEATVFNFKDGVFENDGGYSLRFSGAGLQPGEKATAKWDVTVTMNDDRPSRIYTLYTVMYAPERTVGAVAESRQTSYASNEISSWITGANGVDHSKRAPLGSMIADYHDSGYFKVDPLSNPTTLPSGGTQQTEEDYIVIDEINGSGTSIDFTDDSYVLQTATRGDNHSRSQSYLGLLTVDKSRYSNTNQIPNLKIGYDVLRTEDTQSILGYEYDSLYSYNTYYTLGTSEAFTATDATAAPSGWIEPGTTVSQSSVPARETIVPDFSVSNIDGKYIHAMNRASSYQKIFIGSLSYTKYATAGTSVLCSVTDKSILRERVLSAYNVTDRSTELENSLQNAAAALGNPAATQTEIDKTSRELYEAMAEYADKYYTLKYDNLFSAFEYAQFSESMKVITSNGVDVTNYATASYLNGTITVKNDTLPADTTEVYTAYSSDKSYYLVDLKPNTEYVYEFDVTTNVKAQAFMFFYDSNGKGLAPTAMQVKVNGGAWQAGEPGAAHWGVYPTEASAHYVVKFTTPENTVKGGFRFGNTSNAPVTSTFSNIKLIDSEHYYEDAKYSKTESLHKEYTLYGALIAPERPGYSFMGWKDENGSTVTSTNNATEHLTIYSQWKEVQYKINFNGNGGKGSTTSATLSLGGSVTLPSDFTRDNYELLGWAFDDNATEAVFRVEEDQMQIITVADIFDYLDSDNQVTLYAVWGADFCTINYSNNGASDVSVEEYNVPMIGYEEQFTLPTPTCDYAEFMGWSLNALQNPYDETGVYKGGATIKVSDLPEEKFDTDKYGTTIIRLHAVWKLQSNVFVEDTVISDFGVMMPVNSRENDKGIVGYHSGAEFGGKLEVGLGSVDKKTFEGKYGTFEIYKDGEGNYTQYVAYTPKKIVDALDSEGKAILDTVTYCGQITYPDNSKSEIFTNTITVVPASNTLYEENIVKTTVETPATYQWNKKGTSTIAMQEFSSDGDVYGNDSGYANSTGFSNGTYYAATVNSTSGTDISDKATFTFVGSGFDLVSACGTETGIQVVKVSWKDSTTGKKKSKSYIVDTYFSDKALMTDADGNTSTTDDLLLYQVPIVNFRGAYNTYTVETTAAYFTFAESLKHPIGGTAPAAYSKGVITTDNEIKLETTTTGVTQDILNELDRLGFEDLGEDIEVIYMDEDSVLNQKGVLSGNMPSFFATDSSVHDKNLYSYIDGVRIYNPLNGGKEYYKDSEQNPTYYNIVEELEMDSTQSNMAYIESGNNILDFITDKFNFDAYNQQGGPKGEIYLKEGDAIAFTFKAESNGTAASIMLGLRAVKGTPTANTKVAGKSDSVSVNSATEMYYQIATNVDVNTAGVTVIVINPDDGNKDTNNILAVNNLKLVNGPQSTDDQAVSGDAGAIVGGGSADSLAPTPVVPDAVQGEDGNVEDIPETGVDTDTNVPENDTETDVEDETEINVSTMFPGMPASIASFLEMLFKFLSQLVSSLGF